MKYKGSNKEKVNNVPDAFAETYSVELYMKEQPTILENKLLENIKKYCGNAKIVSSQDNNITIAFMDYILEYKNGSAPVGIVITKINQKPQIEKLKKSLGQSIGFENEQAIEKCNFRILVTDVMAIGLEYTKRVELFQKAIYAIVELMPIEGIHFPITEQVISREAYLENNPLNDDYDLLFGILNVRLFKIPSKEEEYLMDTIGLSAIGLCDLQCHFKNLDPDPISNILYSYGYYFFDNSNELDNIDTVEGISKNDKWKCQHEISLAEPKRIVLDINPGNAFSGGGR